MTAKETTALFFVGLWPLRQRVLAVFEALADAEAAVHGTNPEAVHFHEVGAIDSLVDVVGVCAALEHLQVSSLLCTPPPAGRGTVATAHGVLPVPVPAVLELARRHGLTLRCGVEWPEAELTTPTGLALMALQADGFGWPSVLQPLATGVGLGHRQLDRPNLLRLIQLQSATQSALDQPQWQELVVQEEQEGHPLRQLTLGLPGRSTHRNWLKSRRWDSMTRT